ncbi:MAG: tetratricopeptide repeat protein [Bryobacteraceae bacterium]|nr:tetratricopeptide repeat protein [Bryobacteraceae bacterium]
MTEPEILQYLGNLPNNDVYLPRLVEQLKSPIGIVPFIGAGMSAPFQFPQWTAFLRDLAGRARVADAVNRRLSAGQYEEAADEVISALGQTQFQDLLEHHFGDHVLGGKQLTGAIAVAPRLATGLVITTNFDSVVEKVFAAAGFPFHRVVWHDKVHLAVRALETGTPLLLKIHGSWDDPNHRVLTLAEYEKHYGAASDAVDFNLPLPQLFKLLATRPLLFLGCSLNQDRTVAILRRVAGDLPTSRHYAVLQMPASDEEFQRRARRLGDHNIRPIWYPTGRHEKVEGLLEYLAGQIPAKLRRPAKARARTVGMIPTPRTSFIGRERERDDLGRLLRQHRLLTIVGPPGVGKTRMAIELARAAEGGFDDVWFIQLSQLRDADYVPQRVAAVLGIGEKGRDIREGLAEFFQSGRHLLILDNCEHVVEACSALADQLLDRCPDLKILTTSRAILNVSGEEVFSIQPLELPDLDRLPALDRLKLIDSIELLIARAPSPPFEFSQNNARAVAELCLGLEGIPLAIELAAARLKTRSVEQVRDDLHRLLNLSIGPRERSAERRWDTLRAAIQWSYGLLNAGQSAFFRRLAIFHRGWTLDAAAAVCREAGQDEFRIETLLDELYDMSLLVIDDAGRQRRFRLLDSIREFAHNELAISGEEPKLAEAHATWFLQLAEQAEPELLKKDQAQWLERLSAEADNLRAAIAWAVANRRAETALRLTASLWRLMEIRGFYTEGIRRLRTVLDMPDATAYPALRAKALSGLGMLAYRQGDCDAAGGYFQQSLDIEREAGNLSGVANALNDLGNVANMGGDFETARARYRDSLEIERKTGNERGVAVGLFNLGNTDRKLERFDEAAGHLQESRRRFEDAGNMREAAFPLNALALVALARGDCNTAEQHARKSLGIRQELKDQRGVGESMRTLSAIQMRQGHLDRAYALLSESHELARSVDDKRGIVETLEGFAALAGFRKQFGVCVALHAVTDNLRGPMRMPLAPVDRRERDARLSAARDNLSAADFAQWQETGRCWSAADAVREAASLRAGAGAAAPG